MNSTIDKTLEHVLFLARHLDRRNIRGAIIVALMELGVPTKCIGFELLIHSIVLQYKDPVRALTNDIYLETTLRYRQTSEEQVEQAIREVIKFAWKKGCREAWDWYFSYGGKSVSHRPSNSEFISRIAYIIELWQESEMKEGSYERERIDLPL